MKINQITFQRKVIVKINLRAKLVLKTVSIDL
jgi:hypothetical protein